MRAAIRIMASVFALLNVSGCHPAIIEDIDHVGTIEIGDHRNGLVISPTRGIRVFSIRCHDRWYFSQVAGESMLPACRYDKNVIVVYRSWMHQYVVNYENDMVVRITRERDSFYI